MCEYSNFENGQCKIDNTICPFIYLCSKCNCYRANKAMPTSCKKKEIKELPKNCYKVCFEKNGNLYIQVDDNIVILPSPFENTPLYVKLFKRKDKWIIRE